MDEQPTTFGAELRRRRLAAGLSLAELAERAHYSKSHLSKIENDAKKPGVPLARQCDAALSAGGALVALVALVAPAPSGPAAVAGDDFGEVWLMTMSSDGRSEFGAVTRRVLLASGVAGLASWPALPVRPPSRVDETAITSFRTLFDEVRAIGQHLSPAALVPVLVAQTHALRMTATGARPAVRDRALLLAARYAEYTGWMVQEAGDDNRALWWTDRAVEYARAGGDHELGRYALIRRALVTLYRHDAVATVELAQRAQASGGHPRIRGLAAQREAQGHALAGDHDRCFRALDRAAVLLDAAASHEDGRPVLGTSTIPDPVAMVTGWCLLDLGRPERAAEILRREVDRIPGRARRARALYGARLALALASLGDVDGACAAASPVLDTVEAVDSATVRADLGNLARTLRRWPTHSSVRRTLPRLTAAMHTVATR